MALRTSRPLPAFFSAVLLCGSLGLAQGPPRPPAPISTSQTDLKRERIWPVAGRILAPDGKPLAGVRVQVEVGTPSVPPQKMETNLKGEYRAEYRLDAMTFTKLEVNVMASKEGFSSARGAAELTAAQGSREINLVLRESGEESGLPSFMALAERMAERFRDAGTAGPRDRAREDYQRGMNQMLGAQDSLGAIGPLGRAVQQEPRCLACRELLTLALLDTGRWDAAARHLEEAAKLAPSGGASGARPGPFLILGVLEMWRRDLPKALGYFLRGLEIRPEDPLLLFEAGRTLAEQKNWERADEYLEKALQAGASPEARLLRVQVLLELGENRAAAAEMKTYLGDRRPVDLPLEDRKVYARLKERLELKAYEDARTVIDRSPEEMIRSIPALEGLEPAASQQSFPDVLARVQRNVENFFRQMPNTVSTEDILEESLNRKGEVRDYLDEKFQYLLLARPARSELGLREFRTRANAEAPQSDKLRLGYMRTAGFACTSLHLHPAYRAKVNLRLLGRQVIDQRRTWVIAFAQRPENALVLARFDAEGKSSPMLVQGVAWIDPENFQILRLHTDLLGTPPQTRLTRQTTEIRYGEVEFKEGAASLWLPTEVTVTVEWKGRIFRNRHRYSNYMMFKVETEEKSRLAARPAAPEDRR